MQTPVFKEAGSVYTASDLRGTCLPPVLFPDEGHFRRRLPPSREPGIARGLDYQRVKLYGLKRGVETVVCDSA